MRGKVNFEVERNVCITPCPDKRKHHGSVITVGSFGCAWLCPDHKETDREHKFVTCGCVFDNMEV